MQIDVNNLSRYCQQIPKLGKMAIGFPQPRAERVLIGTNYDVNVGVIPIVKDGIFRKNLTAGTNYIPIAVLDTFVPSGTTHDVSLSLLHTCGYAIIDVSHPGGQFIEIERLRDYGIPQKINFILELPGEGFPKIEADPQRLPHVSEMVATLGYNTAYYYDHRELIDITRRFLP